MTIDKQSNHESGDEFRRVVSKLTKINAALMQRVERSMDQQANAFSLFQTAISQQDQIRKRTEELNQALSRLAHANNELREARDAAERANMFKTRFFTAVGHDLLQPLHAARLTLTELTETQRDGESRRLAGNVSHALSTIEELLTSILDISKLEAGVFVPNIQTVSLGALFERLAASLEPLARRKGLELRIQSTDLAVKSDPLMLRRILQNLLANGVNYTSHGGLLLSARRRDANVRLEVWDTGPGIPQAERNRIFDEFQRGAASERSGGVGFGLGLSIVKRMSEALGHDLEFSTRLKRGTRFTIVAPYSDEMAAPEFLKGIAKFDHVNLRARNVIVIDNDLAVLDAMQTLLVRWGADVRLARNLDDVSEIIGDQGFKPAIVLADYHLDDNIVGIDAIARVREIVQAPIPAILITADRSETTSEAAREIDCELLHKPVRPSELRALMQHMLR